jgi:hypothetical protein
LQSTSKLVSLFKCVIDLALEGPHCWLGTVNRNTQRLTIPINVALVKDRRENDRLTFSHLIKKKLLTLSGCQPDLINQNRSAL